MNISKQLMDSLASLMHDASLEKDISEHYKKLCDKMHVCKMYYDMDLGGKDRYRNQKTGELIVDAKEVGRNLVLYDSGKKSGFSRKYTYYYNGAEYVHAFIDFDNGIKESDIDESVYSFLADIVYILVSRNNMRKMLDFAETNDAFTGIPNISFVHEKYYSVLKTLTPQEIVVIRMNLRNFKNINEICGAKAGDEAIIQYSRKLLRMMDDDESAGRLGGDNFIVFIKKKNLNKFLKKISAVNISKLKAAPKNKFEVSAWVGISYLENDQVKPFSERLNDANVACSLGKGMLNKEIVYYSKELDKMVTRGREVISAFPAAVRNHEFIPFFQPKVDMRTGNLVGFEALCRWFHKDHFIFPDQFIPILDREGLIPELDIAIFGETCRAIRKWKEMGLNPPRISCNFSKKNLFIPKICDKILTVIANNGLSSEDVEIEITESMKDVEYDRLISFVKNMKEHGICISIDDFGTGYSSLSLLHNIEADIIKIDRSFTDKVIADKKAAVLIESIITITNRLDMSIVAEGVETSEQGKMLMDMGCYIAQGYYYSKPVDYETATEYIKNLPFKAIV
ncbi:MAG: bifunctional diguanylate cyclase/phosphodiesterase [Butyrivibrio sp.]|nr:bifunctional diguanylate cyclase/phosphodiesterase [Butyrivibrio sp.]